MTVSPCLETSRHPSSSTSVILQTTHCSIPPKVSRSAKNVREQPKQTSSSQLLSGVGILSLSQAATLLIWNKTLLRNIAKAWGIRRVQKNCFLWWPQMNQADLHWLWEMEGRERNLKGKADRKVKEGGQGTHRGAGAVLWLGCLQSCKEAGGVVSIPPQNYGLCLWQG